MTPLRPAPGDIAGDYAARAWRLSRDIRSQLLLRRRQPRSRVDCTGRTLPPARRLPAPLTGRGRKWPAQPPPPRLVPGVQRLCRYAVFAVTASSGEDGYGRLERNRLTTSCCGDTAAVSERGHLVIEVKSCSPGGAAMRSAVRFPPRRWFLLASARLGVGSGSAGKGGLTRRASTPPPAQGCQGLCGTADTSTR